MTSNINELKEIFEYELKTKLSEKAKISTNELKTLLNCFKYYDINREGLADETMWINSILRTGISGFSQNDLEHIFRTYVKNPTDSINYQEFCNYIFGKEDLSKISYTQIKNKKLKYDLKNNNTDSFNKEKNYVRNNFQNIDLSKYNRTYLNKQKEYESVSHKNNENNNYELLVEKLKEKIHINNGMIFYTFVKNLKTNEETLSQSVSIDELSLSIQQLKLNISSNDIYEFFNYLDSEKTGRVSSNVILNILKGELNDRRKIYLNKVFKILDTDKKAEISINKLKNTFDAKNHPDVLNNNKGEDEIYNQFCYTMDIYIRFSNILNYSINNEQFIEYYSGISPSIKDDDYFEQILENVWGVEKKKTEKKKYYNIIYKNNYDIYQEGNEMGMNSIFFGQSNSQRPIYNYDYDYLEEFYKSSSSTLKNKNNNYYKKSNLNKIRNNFRNKTQNDLNQNNINNKLIFSTLNTNNTNNIKSPKKYFLYESDNTKENHGIRVFKKKRYNPITDEFIQESNSFNNGYNTINKIMNNAQTNQKEKKEEELIKEEILPDENNKDEQNKEKNNIFHFNSFNNNNIKENESLSKFRQLLISQGTKGIFRFQKMLSIYDRNSSGFISFDNFHTIYQSNYTSIPLEDIKSIFSLFENNNENRINDSSENKIKYDLLLKSLVGNIPIKRRILIQKVFNTFNKEKKNKVMTSEIKNKFNASRHPDVIKGIKTENKILGEFLDLLETFREYNNNLHGFNFSMSFQEFCDFYSQISLSIKDDKYFEMLLTNCWDLDQVYKKEEENVENVNKEKNNEKYNNVNNNNYRKGTFRSNSENKQYNQNIRMKAGAQIINNRIFY